MPTSRQYGRSERQQGYAAARAVQAMARKLRGKKLSSKEARALTHLASVAAGGSARSAERITLGGKHKSRRRRRSAIRGETRRYVRGATGERRRKGRKSSGRSSSSGWSRRDRKFKKSWTQKTYGPLPFEAQPKKTRKRYLRQWKRKGYRRVRRYA